MFAGLKHSTGKGNRGMTADDMTRNSKGDRVSKKKSDASKNNRAMRANKNRAVNFARQAGRFVKVGDDYMWREKVKTHS